MKISILGCGWLGTPLAEELIGEGHLVKGSTTTEEKLERLEAKGITPFLLDLDPELNSQQSDEFWNSDILFLNIPPGRRRNNVVEYHTSQIKSVIKKLRNSPVQFVIFASSTSVYPKKGGIMEEQDISSGKATRSSGEALIKAEQMLRDETDFETTVIRFGGLYGYDRNPARYLAGKKDIADGNAPINLIHRDDCIKIVLKIIHRDIRNEVFNAVSDGHPPKNQFYKLIAKQAGLEPPTFRPDSGKNYKVISNRKLIKRLDYQFIYPNPMDFVAVAS